MTRLEALFYAVYYAYISFGAGYFLKKIIKRDIDLDF